MGINPLNIIEPANTLAFFYGILLNKADD